jgi:L-lactate dehydrogenase complex protein LldF
MTDVKTFKHLSFASSLCGSCTSVCPVKIPLHELILVNRNDSVESGFTTFWEKQTMKWATKTLNSRKNMNRFSGKTKNKLASKFFKKYWGPRRYLPEISPKSFNELWVEKFGEEK